MVRPELPFEDLLDSEFNQEIFPLVQQVFPQNVNMNLWSVEWEGFITDYPVGSMFANGRRYVLRYNLRDVVPPINVIQNNGENWSVTRAFINRLRQIIQQMLQMTPPFAPALFRIYLVHDDNQLVAVDLQSRASRGTYFNFVQNWHIDVMNQLGNAISAFAEQYNVEARYLDEITVTVEFARAQMQGGARNGAFPPLLKNVRQYLFNPSSGDCYLKCLKHMFELPLADLRGLFGDVDTCDYNDLFELTVKYFPHISVRLFNANGDLRDRIDGEDFDKESILYLVLFESHYFRILNINKFIEELKGNKFYCRGCDRQFPSPDVEHTSCASWLQCERCNYYADNQQDMEEHKDGDQNGFKHVCLYCSRDNFKSEACLNYHIIHCSAKIFAVDTLRNKRLKIEPPAVESETISRCPYKNCRKRFKTQEQYWEHVCYVDKREEKEQMFEEAYAFDYEAMLVPHPEKPNTFIHQVNRVDVQQFIPPTHQTWGFKSLQEFVDWIATEIGVKEFKVAFYAHNLKGYDGRLTLAKLFCLQSEDEDADLVQDMCWDGAKIIKFKWKNVLFRDSLTHIAQPLAKFPSTFGLNELHKGYFPYSFNTPDNQNYVGPMPDIKYYDLKYKTVKDRKDFLKWYEEHKNDTFDMQKELELYCKSDVDILARSMEIYNNAGLELNELPPLNCLTIASYTVDCWWVKYFPEKTIAHHNWREDENCREALRGGRTDVRMFYKKYSMEDVFINKKFARYIDVQSMYPFVMFNREYPVGKPRIIEGGTVEDIKNSFGYCKIDIYPPKHYVHHPVLVHSQNNKLVATLEPWLGKTWCTPEIWAALEQGWVVTKIYWIQTYPERSTSLFKEYLSHLLAEKIHASSDLPDNFNELAERWWQAFQIEVKADKFGKNPGKRAVAKTQVNSFWGKLCEKYKSSFAVNANAQKFKEMEDEELLGKVRVTSRYRLAADRWFIAGEKVSTFNEHFQKVKHRERTCSSVGVFVPMWGRMMLWEEMNKLGKRVLYHDTDSIIYEYDEGYEYDEPKYNTKEGVLLGDWEAELNGNPIIEFVALAPKTYAYRYIEINKPIDIPANADSEFFKQYQPYKLWEGKLYQVKEEVKVKGFKLHSEAKKSINFDGLLGLYVKDKTILQTPQLTFKYDRQVGQITSTMTDKHLIFNYEKGVIGSDNYSFPFGVQRYWDQTYRNVEEGTEMRQSLYQSLLQQEQSHNIE
jgi:hypothetical protein